MPSKCIQLNTDHAHKPHLGKKAPPRGTDAYLNLAALSAIFTDEEKARAFVEAKRWPNGVICPHCECGETYTLTAKAGSKSPVRPGVHKCKRCHKQFTVRIGTIIEGSKISFCVWLMAIHLMTGNKKGISSHRIARECDITVKSAWFLTRRIREVMTLEPMSGMLNATVECDEPCDNRHSSSPSPSYRHGIRHDRNR